MVCDRCIAIVKSELDKVGVAYKSVELGETTIPNKITTKQHKQLFTALKYFGFELMNSQKSKVIEKLKLVIVDLECNSDEDLKTTYSDYIRLIMNEKFIPLNTLHSEINGISIEKYIIKHKVDMVKELLQNKALSLNDIANKLHYSNVNQLTSQFKSITGMTPVHFREILQYKNLNQNRNTIM